MKAGRTTSEFWLAVLIIVVDAIGAITQLIPAEQAGWLGTVTVVAYNLSRGLAKLRPTPDQQVVAAPSGHGSVVVQQPETPPVE